MPYYIQLKVAEIIIFLNRKKNTQEFNEIYKLIFTIEFESIG